MKYVDIDDNDIMWIPASAIDGLFNKSHGWARNFSQRNGISRKQIDTKTARTQGKIWVYDLNTFIKIFLEKNTKNS